MPLMDTNLCFHILFLEVIVVDDVDSDVDRDDLDALDALEDVDIGDDPDVIARSNNPPGVIFRI